MKKEGAVISLLLPLGGATTSTITTNFFLGKGGVDEKWAEKKRERGRRGRTRHHFLVREKF